MSRVRKKPADATAGTCVALLRGINVGGKNALAMKGLAAMFAKAGCSEVRTYIQSGNVIFSATEGTAQRVCDLVLEAIATEHGFRPPVVLRTAAELRSIVEQNPFVAEGLDPQRLHVGFLAARPTPAQLSTLDADRSPPDRFAVRGGEVYLFCPDGFGSSKLTNSYFDARLSTVTTIRNWRTVLKLLELVGPA